MNGGQRNGEGAYSEMTRRGDRGRVQVLSPISYACARFFVFAFFAAEVLLFFSTKMVVEEGQETCYMRSIKEGPVRGIVQKNETRRDEDSKCKMRVGYMI